MLLLSVGVGHPLRIAVRASHGWSGTFLGGSDIAIGLDFSLLFVFTWRVFRPQATWARVVLTIWAVAMQVDTWSSPWVLLPSSIKGLSQAVLLVLAFVPPQSYLRWVRARTAASGS